MRLEGLSQLRINPMTSWGIKLVTFRLVAFFFIYLVCETFGTAATPALLCQPRVIVKMIVEKQMECRLAGEKKFSEKTCLSATFVHHKIPHDQTRVSTRAAAMGMAYFLHVNKFC
jgi:hypothetical protein